ncbi:MAG TPA: SiaB family protein kinase, partial [Cytophagaceae bacterium]|nr:SiaB family protein kinase [Cytophagaceae bacterium]
KTSSMKYVHQLHKTMVDNSLILVYEGEFTQEITKSVLSMAERNLDYMEEESSTKKKVFNVMVECLQNICKHTDKVADDKLWNSAIFMIAKDSEYYSIVSGNAIENTAISFLEEKLEQINSLDREGLKHLYKDMLVKAQLSEKGGAGLGFVDIARKSGQKLEYYFDPINDQSSFFCFKTKIARVNE